MSANIVFSLSDWWSLFTHFMLLSLLAVGGAITTAPDMHRYLVTQQHWLSDSEFTTSIALAQAAPGPNVLFVALMGWQVGLNAAPSVGASEWSWLCGLTGVFLAMSGILLPSSVLTYTATRWAHKNRSNRAVKAFKMGMAPIVVALLMATGWLLAAAHDQPSRDWPLWLTTVVATIVVWKTRIHMLWLLGFGALLGGLGWI